MLWNTFLRQLFVPTLMLWGILLLAQHGSLSSLSSVSDEIQNRTFPAQRFTRVPLGTHSAAPQPVATLDLASSTAWTVSVDGGRPRTLIVPGGG